MKYNSRKFWLSLITSGLIVGTGVLAGTILAVGAHVPVVVGGLLTVYGIYCGGNVATKWVEKK
jgi:hypothetical protein